MANLKLNEVRLRTLLIVGALLGAVIPVLVLGIGTSIEMRRLVVSDALTRGALDAENLADDIDQAIVERRDITATLAEHLSGLPQLTPEAVTPFLRRTRDANGLTSTFSVAGTDGVLFVAEPPAGPDGTSTIGLNLNERAYFREVMQSKKFVIDRNVIVSPTTRRPVVVLAAPILDAAKALRAVLITSIEVPGLEELAERFQRSGAVATVVTTAAGITLASQSRNEVEGLFDYSKTRVWPLVTAEPSGVIDTYVDQAGAERLAGFATVPTTGWKVWIGRPLSELDTQVLAVYRNVVLWPLLAILLAMSVGYWQVRVISRPVETVRRAAEYVANGTFTHRAPERGPHELAALARGINTMAATLQKNAVAERQVTERLEQAVTDYGALATRVASGDLAARVAANGNEDELSRLGDGLNGMAASLERLVGEVSGASSSIASAAAEILAATSQQVSATTEEATAVRQTAATVAEVRQTAEAAAKQTRAVADLALRSATTAKDGQKSVAESVRGSEAAKVGMEKLAERILAFSDHAQAIADINATVSDLAEQSNLLAVNAGIEAAKAGEVGRGFAVVAVEVKGLAERCKEATVQVRRIVTEIQKSAQAAVMAAEQGVKVAEAGVSAAQKSGEAISTLSQSVIEASQSAQQILAAAEQQEAGMDQIALAMGNIEQSSTQTVSATQQVERAARDLNDLAQRMSSLLSMSSPQTGRVRQHA